jgi:hypothetical protein
MALTGSLWSAEGAHFDLGGASKSNGPPQMLQIVAPRRIRSRTFRYS